MSTICSKKIEINKNPNRTKSKTAMKSKTAKDAPKEENKDEKLFIMSNVVVFRQDSSLINSRLFKVSLCFIVL